MAKLQAPQNFDFNHPEKWEDWIRRFERYRIASKLHGEDENVQVNCLIYSMGEEADSIFSTLDLSADDQKSYKVVVDAFGKHFMPKANPVHWRCLLRRRLQGENENIETYVRELFNIADKCKYSNKSEEIRDQFIIGIRDKSVSKTLQSDPELTLETTVMKARQEEVLKMQVDSQYSSCSTGAAASADSLHA